MTIVASNDQSFNRKRYKGEWRATQPLPCPLPVVPYVTNARHSRYSLSSSTVSHGEDLNALGVAGISEGR